MEDFRTGLARARGAPITSPCRATRAAANDAARQPGPVATPGASVVTDHACGLPTCTIDWLFVPGGARDPLWLARARAEARRKRGSRTKGTDAS